MKITLVIGLFFLVVISSGCIEYENGKITIDFETKFPTEQTTNIEPKNLCEKNIREDIEFKKKTAIWPFKIVYVDFTLVMNPSEAKKRIYEIGDIFTPGRSWYDKFPDGDASYLGIGVVEITKGQKIGKRRYYYYGCDLKGDIFNKPSGMIG